MQNIVQPYYKVTINKHKFNYYLFLTIIINTQIKKNYENMLIVFKLTIHFYTIPIQFLFVVEIY